MKKFIITLSALWLTPIAAVASSSSAVCTIDANQFPEIKTITDEEASTVYELLYSSLSDALKTSEPDADFSLKYIAKIMKLSDSLQDNYLHAPGAVGELLASYLINLAGEYKLDSRIVHNIQSPIIKEFVERINFAYQLEYLKEFLTSITSNKTAKKLLAAYIKNTDRTQRAKIGNTLKCYLKNIINLKFHAYVTDAYAAFFVLAQFLHYTFNKPESDIISFLQQATNKQCIEALASLPLRKSILEFINKKMPADKTALLDTVRLNAYKLQNVQSVDDLMKKLTLQLTDKEKAKLTTLGYDFYDYLAKSKDATIINTIQTACKIA